MMVRIRNAWLRGEHWLNKRLPISVFWRRHLLSYTVPSNLNFWYFFGAVVIFLFGYQMASGLSLAVHYLPSALPDHEGTPLVLASLQRIASEVPWGNVLLRGHVWGGTLFFIALYLHLFRALLYGAYRKPRELTWLLGCWLLLMALMLAFFGRLLSWSQDAYWGTTAALNLLSTIPVLGPDMALALRGDTLVGSETLGRFYVLHAFLLPWLLLGMMALHVICVRCTGSGNPDGVEGWLLPNSRGKRRDRLAYHPYYTIRDLLAVVSCLFLLACLVFLAPPQLLDILQGNGVTRVDGLATPEHVRPAWYFAPYFSMLRAGAWDGFGVDARLWSILVLLAALILPFLLPWLDHAPVSSYRYRGRLSQTLLALWVLSFLLLGGLAFVPRSTGVERVLRFCVAYYFLFFLLMPVWSRLDRCRLPPWTWMRR